MGDELQSRELVIACIVIREIVKAKTERERKEEMMMMKMEATFIQEHVPSLSNSGWRGISRNSFPSAVDATRSRESPHDAHTTYFPSLV